MATQLSRRSSEESFVSRGIATRVLLVERCRLSRHLEAVVLRRAGIVVQEVGSVHQALQRLRYGQFDAVLIDPDLPDMSCPQLLSLVRQKAPSASLIAVSGRAFPAERQLALGAGCDAYIVKPICTKTFAADVEAAAGRRTALLMSAAEI